MIAWGRDGRRGENEARFGEGRKNVSGQTHKQRSKAAASSLVVLLVVLQVVVTFIRKKTQTNL